MNVYSLIKNNTSNNKKQFAVLIDPDSYEGNNLKEFAKRINASAADYVFVGGSLVNKNNIDECIANIKEYCDKPVILFPGTPLQISRNADAILFLSLISSRNPELLIGHHVVSAPILKSYNIEVMPTGYMLIDGGKPTAVSYMSNSFPIPSDKHNIAVCTSMAGEMLGLKLIFMDAGSGAKTPISNAMITKVKKNIGIPLIIGGGITTADSVCDKFNAGADIVVIGNAFEKNNNLIDEITNKLEKVK